MTYPLDASISADYAGMADTPAEAASLLVEWLRDGGLDTAHVLVTMSDGTIVPVSPTEIAAATPPRAAP